MLRQLGERGILIIKDFTSILSADRNLRSPMLAALREIDDGKWVRSLGSDGGMTYVWEGRIIVLAACTTAWDSAYGVIATMGDRFVTIRSSARTGRGSAGTRALRNTGSEAGMRSEINEAVAALLKTVVPREYPLSDDETESPRRRRRHRHPGTNRRRNRSHGQRHRCPRTGDADSASSNSW